MARLFPMFVKLEARTVLVIGAGSVAEQKIRGLLDTGAHIRVIALLATAAVTDWAESGQIALEEREFLPSDLDGIFLAVGAGSRESNQSLFAEARRRGVLCNVVDVPGQCDFFYPAVVQRGDLQIAVSTAGQSPSLAQRLRQQLERQFGPAYEEWVARLGETRREVLESRLSPERKRWLLQALASREAFEAALASQTQGGEKAS